MSILLLRFRITLVMFVFIRSIFLSQPRITGSNSPNSTPTFQKYLLHLPTPVVAQSLGLWVRNPPGEWMTLVSVVCCQIEVSASGSSLVQRNPAECGVSECDRETSIMRRPWPTRGCCTLEGRITPLGHGVGHIRPQWSRLINSTYMRVYLVLHLRAFTACFKLNLYFHVMKGQFTYLAFLLVYCRNKFTFV
jgi:hypothetical protein